MGAGQQSRRFGVPRAGKVSYSGVSVLGLGAADGPCRPDAGRLRQQAGRACGLGPSRVTVSSARVASRSMRSHPGTMPPMGPDTTTDEVLDGVDLTGTTALVTGASGGLGVETARTLADHGARLVLAVRDLAKGEQALATAGIDPSASDPPPRRCGPVLWPTPTPSAGAIARTAGSLRSPPTRRPSPASSATPSTATGPGRCGRCRSAWWASASGDAVHPKVAPDEESSVQAGSRPRRGRLHLHQRAR